MKKLYFLILRPILALIYIIGLSFIIPFLLSASLPEEVASKYNSVLFLVLSIILLIISIVGTFYLKESVGKTLKHLAYYSFVPGILSILITAFGKGFLINFFSNKTLQSIITNYLDIRLPKLWFLTVAYILLGIILYIVGDKLE